MSLICCWLLSLQPPRLGRDEHVKSIATTCLTRRRFCTWTPATGGRGPPAHRSLVEEHRLRGRVPGCVAVRPPPGPGVTHRVVLVVIQAAHPGAPASRCRSPCELAEDVLLNSGASCP